jgi:DNA polymerase, archaea type
MDEEYDERLFGHNAEQGIVAVEFEAGRGSRPDRMALFRRAGATLAVEHEPFEPFIVAAETALRDCPLPCRLHDLAGTAPLNRLAVFTSWADCRKAAQWLSKSTGFSAGSSAAPYLFANDPVHQHLLLSGRTQFLGMTFDSARRMQVDIECLTTPGYDFCHAARAGDRIAAIALGDGEGWTETLVHDCEAKMLRQFARIVEERDPDIIEGHNLFNFDLPYLTERARRHGVTLTLGRDGSVPRQRPSRFTAGERTIAYTRCDIFGRHVADTFFMATAYDVAHRSLSGRGLKAAARHFGVAAERREYIEGSDIGRVFQEDRERFLRYARDDIAETRALSAILSRSFFAQTQMLPFSYQNVCVRGGATKIDALMIRAYLHARRALPQPDRPRPFAGGYAAVFVRGLVKNVRHCDVRSLYPSLMLTRKLAPASDELGAFIQLLERLKEVRMTALERRTATVAPAERSHWDALQSAFKTLINSFYGYLGFAQAHFSDFDAAEQVAAQGRRLLQDMVEWLQEHGAQPVEIDTDGIYFVPPAPDDDRPRFESAFRRALPSGIEVEFDGEYPAMYSYKVKNYALLSDDGEMTIKGAALKSRGLEPFQRQFLEGVLRLKLEGRADRVTALKDEYATAIRQRTWPIRMLAKTETLADAPETYRQKRDQGRRARSAPYELALRANRSYRAGDQIAYYIAGDKRTVAAHEAARAVSAWDPQQRDENVPYYLAKLDSLHKKFAQEEELL